MDLGNGLGHLTYSTLVHPADDWPQLWDSLQRYLPPVKKRIAPNQPFGVCIRLSHLTAATLLTLGLEPEPRCHLETTDETIAYFQQHLYTGTSAARLSKLAHIPMDTAIAALRRHLGVVFDIGHQAVGFEDIPLSLQKLVDAGIPIVKLQEAASMYIGEVNDEKVEALKHFAKTVYLSQTVECRGDHLEHYLNLEDAFAGWAT